MPKVEHIFAQLNGAKYFSTLVLQAGHHRIHFDESSIPKQPLPPHLENMNMSSYPSDSHKHLHIFRNA